MLFSHNGLHFSRKFTTLVRVIAYIFKLSHTGKFQFGMGLRKASVLSRQMLFDSHQKSD